MQYLKFHHFLSWGSRALNPCQALFVALPASVSALSQVHPWVLSANHSPENAKGDPSFVHVACAWGKKLSVKRGTTETILVVLFRDRYSALPTQCRREDPCHHTFKKSLHKINIQVSKDCQAHGRLCILRNKVLGDPSQSPAQMLPGRACSNHSA